MVRFENDCCGCAVPGYPCIGEACDFWNVMHLYCDSCPQEVEDLYKVDDLWICFSCLCKIADKAEVDEEDLIEGHITNRH